MNVLVVEDNVPVRQTIVDVLAFMDHDVYQAASAEEALSLLARLDSPPDLLISDVSLPGLDGPSLLHAIQRRYPRCQGLLTSGLPREHHNLGGLQFMQKPFSIDQLMAHVDAAAGALVAALT